MNVPGKYYQPKRRDYRQSQYPWIKQFENLDNKGAAQINLKSVLSLLAVKVNSPEVKVSFENGEFRLEAPPLRTTNTSPAPAPPHIG